MFRLEKRVYGVTPKSVTSPILIILHKKLGALWTLQPNTTFCAADLKLNILRQTEHSDYRTKLRDFEPRIQTNWICQLLLPGFDPPLCKASVDRGVFWCVTVVFRCSFCLRKIWTIVNVAAMLLSEKPAAQILWYSGKHHILYRSIRQQQKRVTY